MGFKMPGMPPPTKKQLKDGIDIGGFKLPPSDADAYNVPERFREQLAEHMPLCV